MAAIVLPASHPAKYVSPYELPGTAHASYAALRKASVLLRATRLGRAAPGIHDADVGEPQAYAPPVTMLAPPRARAVSWAPAASVTVSAASSVGSMGLSESTTRPEGVSTTRRARHRPKSLRKSTDGTVDAAATLGSPRYSSVFVAAPQWA
jgi:hypothetical protein